MHQCATLTLDSEEEEVLVYVELGDDVEIEQFKTINVLGVNTKNPIVQMDENVFMGKYENPIGTYMFFKDVPPPQCRDPVFDKVPNKNLEYLCKTRKLIKMEHAYIKPNSTFEQNSENKSQQCHNIIEPVNFDSYEDALYKFKCYWDSVGSEGGTITKDEIKDK